MSRWPKSNKLIWLCRYLTVTCGGGTVSVTSSLCKLWSVTGQLKFLHWASPQQALSFIAWLIGNSRLLTCKIVINTFVIHKWLKINSNWNVFFRLTLKILNPKNDKIFYSTVMLLSKNCYISMNSSFTSFSDLRSRKKYFFKFFKHTQTCRLQISKKV